MKIRTLSEQLKEAVIQSIGCILFLYCIVILYFGKIESTLDMYVTGCYIAVALFVVFSYMTYNYKESHLYLMYMTYWLVITWSFTTTTTLAQPILSYAAVFFVIGMLLSLISFISSWKSETERVLHI